MNLFDFKTENKPKKQSKLCGICGEQHFYRDCKYVAISSNVPDKVIPTKAKLSLPDTLELKTHADESYSVVSRALIPTGTEFGPFIAPKNATLNPFCHFSLKIFTEHESDYYLDTTNENECSWLMFVTPANYVDEQNFICYQVGESVFFASIRDINRGETLRVWYSPYYAAKMCKCTLSFKAQRTETSKSDADMNALVKQQQKIVPREIWNCKFCYKLEKGVVEFAKHLYTHYSLEQRKMCPHCKQTFLYAKDYKNHVKLFHENGALDMIKTHKATETVPTKKALIEAKECAGDPLLVHNLLTDSFDSSNLLAQPFELNALDVEVHDLLENDHLNLGVDVTLSDNMKELEYLNGDANKKEYVCDICLKKFASLKAITSHLKLHIGKYFCAACKKIFARQENLKQHKCNHTFSSKCTKCDRVFYQRKYLVRHAAVFHDKKYRCDRCRKFFHSSRDLTGHVCACVAADQRPTFQCTVCSKTFFKEAYLKKHQKTHEEKPARKADATAYVCSECTRTFSTKRIYDRHLMTVHRKLYPYECRICDKAFNRSDILKSHMESIHMLGRHAEVKVVKCVECSKTFKSKRSLNAHMATHRDVVHKCHCGALFKYNYNLIRHGRQFHGTLPVDPAPDEMLFYECPICHNRVKLKRSLQRHIRRKHPEEYKDVLKNELSARRAKLNKKLAGKPFDEEFDNTDTDQKCLDLRKTIENMDFNMDTCNDNLLLNGTETIDKFLRESSEQIATLFGDSPRASDVSNDLSSVAAASVGRTGNREVCLSMPDLSEGDQEIKLGKNAYFLENGNIVEPQENSSNVVVYVLNDKTV